MPTSIPLRTNSRPPPEQRPGAAGVPTTTLTETLPKTPPRTLTAAALFLGAVPAAAFAHAAGAGGGSEIGPVSQNPAGITERVEHAVEVGSDATVTVMNFAGHVEVHETDPGEARLLRIVGVKRLTEERPAAEAARLFERVNLDLTRRGRHFHIGPQPRRRDGAPGARPPPGAAPDPADELPITEIRAPRRIPPVSVDLEVWLPDGASLVVRTFSAPISLAGVVSPEGNFRLRSISGAMTVRGLETDTFHAETVSGPLDIRDLTARRSQLQTLGADIHLDGAFLPAGWYDLQTHSGTVTLDLESLSGFTVEATTYTGVIESAFEIDGQSDPRGLHGNWGDGGPQIAVNTFSGAIRLVRGGATGAER